MKILIIDDDYLIRSTLSEMFSDLGYFVFQAVDGEEGLHLYQKNREEVDVILTDINMPNIDGLVLLEELRKEDDEIPVIIMTGAADLNTSVKALKLGAFDFLVKPFHPRELISTFNKLESILTSKKNLNEIFPSVSGQVHFSIPSQSSLISGSVGYLHSLLVPFSKFHKVDHHKISLCLHESISNAIIHGNLQVSSQLKEESWEKFKAMVVEREKDEAYGKKEVSISYYWSPEYMSFEISDQGSGFEYNELPDPDDPMSLLSSGRGILLISSFMDEVKWNEFGNKVLMRKVLK